MTIKDVLKITALMIGRGDVIKYLNDDQTASVGVDTVDSVNVLVGLANLVINELSCTYIPMVKLETVSVESGKIYYGNLSEKVLHVREVYSSLGTPVSYTETAKYIAVDLNKVDVEYEYAPKTLGIDEQTGYEEKDVPARVLSYGVAAEFAISEGRFDDAVTFHKRYVDALSEILVPKNVTVKKRSFC